MFKGCRGKMRGVSVGEFTSCPPSSATFLLPFEEEGARTMDKARKKQGEVQEKKHISTRQSVRSRLSVRSLTQNKVLPSPPATWRASAAVAPPTASLLLLVVPAATASKEAGSKPCSAPSPSASIFTLSARKAE